MYSATTYSTSTGICSHRLAGTGALRAALDGRCQPLPDPLGACDAGESGHWGWWSGQRQEPGTYKVLNVSRMTSSASTSAEVTACTMVTNLNSPPAMSSLISTT